MKPVCASDCRTCTHQDEPIDCLEASGTRYRALLASEELARLRRERIEQEAASLELAGLIRKAERERDEIASAFAQSEKHLEDSRDSLATIIDEAFGPQEVLPTMSDLLSRLESLLNAQISKHQTALKERDEARAEVASWVEWSDHHSVWKVLASERPPPEEIRSELGGYLDDREQHLATLAQTISERDEARADSHRYSTECDMARLERDTARTGRAAWEQLYNERNRALRAIQDKRERALVELARNGCDCECDCDSEGHGDDREPCLACRIGAILEDRP